MENSRRDQTAQAHWLAHAHRKLIPHPGRSGEDEDAGFAGGVVSATMASCTSPPVSFRPCHLRVMSAAYFPSS
jgi:hypothetical protein